MQRLVSPHLRICPFRHMFTADDEQQTAGLAADACLAADANDWIELPELRIDDGGVTWRIVYHVDLDAIVILHVFEKKSRTTPKQVIEVSRKRLRTYQRAIREDSR